MEYYPLTKTEKGVNVTAIPNAKKFIALTGPKAKRLADLALHKEDLEFASKCLEALNADAALEDATGFLRESLWRCAIVHFTKCFGESIRFQLSAPKIYKGAPMGLAAFEYFKNLRNYHFIHDQNSYLQSHPGAALNDGKKAHKVERVVCLHLRGDTLDQGNFSNLELLIKTAHTWVESEFETLCLMLKTELEKESYASLISKQEMTFTAPQIDGVGTKRAT